MDPSRPAPPGLDRIVREHLEHDVAELLQDSAVQDMGDRLAEVADLSQYLSDHGFPTHQMIMRCSWAFHEKYGRPTQGRAAFGAIAVAVLRRARQTQRTRGGS